MLAYHLTEFRCQSAIYDIENGHFIDFITNSGFLSHFGENTWRQVKVNRIYNFVGELTVSISVNQSFSKLFSVGFATTVVFYFYVKILTPFRPKELAASVVWANVSSINFPGCPSKVLLSSVFRVRRRRTLVRCLLKLVRLALNSTQRLLFLSALLNSSLSFLRFKKQFLLVLLLTKSVKELVWLSHNLRH